MDGKPLYKGTYTVSNDGKTMTNAIQSSERGSNRNSCLREGIIKQRVLRIRIGLPRTMPWCCQQTWDWTAVALLTSSTNGLKNVVRRLASNGGAAGEIAIGSGTGSPARMRAGTTPAQMGNFVVGFFVDGWAGANFCGDFSKAIPIRSLLSTPDHSAVGPRAIDRDNVIRKASQRVDLLVAVRERLDRAQTTTER